MEKKYSIRTQDAEGNQHNVGFSTDEETVKKMVNILISGQDPNALVDIVIHTEIVR